MADVKINVQVITKAAQDAVKGLNTLVNTTTKGFANLTKGVENVSKAILNVSKAGAQITNSLSKIAKNTSNLFSKFVAADLASNAIRRLSSAAIDLVKDSLQVAVSLEKASARFQVFTGSVSEANKFVKELSDLEDQTPFEFEQISNAAQKLLSFGRSTQQTKEDLKSLADVATASGASIEEIATIFGKAASSGIVSGRELNGLQANSIPIIAELSKQLGVTGVAVKKLANDGKIDFATFEQAFKSLSKEGGFAFGATQKQAETLGGRIKTLGDAFEQFQITLGQRLGPVLKAIITTFTGFVNNINGYVSSVDGANKSSNILLSALKLIAQTAVIVVNAFNGLHFAANAFLGILSTFPGAIFKYATLPLQLIIDLFVKLTSAIGLPNQALKNLQASFQSIRDFLPGVSQEFFNTADNIGTSMAANKQAVDDFGKTLESNYNKEIQLSQAATKQAEEDAKKRRELDIAREEDSRKQRERAAAENKIAREKELADKIQKEEEEKTRILQLRFELENEKQRIADEAKLIALESQVTADGEKDARDQLELLKLQDQLASKRELEELNRQSLIAIDQKYFNLKDKQANDAAKRQQAIRDQEIAADKESVNKRAEFFSALTTVAKIGGKGLFEVAQKLQLANATIAGITAIQQAASALPFPANIPGIVIETARAATTIASIKSQSPSFEEGGIVPGSSFSGDNIKANVNSGEMILNRQQQATLFDIANGRGGGGQEIVVHTNVQIGEETVAKAVSRQVAQGFKLGEGGV